jgi:Fanconi anemia group M protein
MDENMPKGDPPKLRIIADHRETASGVISELRRLGVEVEIQQLKVGDFIVSDHVGIERKSIPDFLQSIIDKRLLEQAGQLTSVFKRPIMILEGEGLYWRRSIHPNAIRGALAALSADFGISILPTSCPEETGLMLVALAKREQVGKKREVAIRGEPKKLSIQEYQRFLVEGLPGVSAVLAKRLLLHFGTVGRVMRASEKDLQKVQGIGKEKAKRIREVLTAEYGQNSTP